MRVDSTSGQHSRFVSPLVTLLGVWCKDIDSVRSCDEPKVRASSFVDHLDHCSVVFQEVELG